MHCTITALAALILMGLACTGAAQEGREKDSVRTTLNGKPFAAVIDIFPQLCLSKHDEARVDREIALLADLGIKRIYFVVCLPGYPSFSNPWLSLLPPGNDAGNHALESVVALDSPNFALCRAAKKRGLEAYAILKPYEGGGGSTIPHGARIFWEDGGRRPDVGGDRVLFDSFLADHPEMAVARKPIPNYARDIDQPIQRVELAFCLEAIPATARAAAIRAAAADYRCKDHPVEFKLWSSKDNGAYAPVAKEYEIAERIESRIIRGVNGRPLFPEKQRCRIVEITGLNLDRDTGYLAVSLHGEAKEISALKTIPCTMINAFGPGAPIPTTSAVHSRHGGSAIQGALPPAERLWGLETHPKRNVMDFRDWGFEFEWYGADIWFGDGWHGDSVYALGRGKIMTMKGTHCEAYPEVRAYWLEQVATLIDMGYDGVDIRLQNHSSMVSDIANFGFNPPLTARYQERYGADPLGKDYEPLKMMAVRGQFFQDFLKEAADLLHQNGRKLQVHLRHAHQEPKLRSDFNELGFWAMPKIWLEDWKGIVDLADEVTIKDYYWGNYRPEGARDIKEYAHQQGKPVWIHNYIGQGDAIRPDFINAVSADPNVSGILLYEAFHAGTASNEPNEGLISVGGPIPTYHQAAHDALMSVSKLTAVR